MLHVSGIGQAVKKTVLFYYMHEKMNKQNTTRIKNKNNTS